MNLPDFAFGAFAGCAGMAIVNVCRFYRDAFTPDIDEPDPADDAIGDQSAIPGGRTISYTYLLMDDYGNVAPGQTEYDDPAQVSRHWVGPIVKVTREWGSES
jgi:hypothetical protein